MTCLLRTRVPSSPEASEASGEQGGTSSIPGEEGNCLCGENASGGKGIYRYFCCGLSMKLFASLISLHTFSVLFLSYSLLHASFINFVSIFSCLFIAVDPGCSQNLWRVFLFSLSLVCNQALVEVGASLFTQLKQTVGSF